jgi:hypothetical protein
MYPRSSPPELSGFERSFVRSASNIQPWMLGIIMSLFTPFLLIIVQSSFFPLVIITFIWLGISLQNYVLMKCAFLAEAAPRDVPSERFTGTLAQLGKTAENLDRLGFEEVDRFYLKRSYNAIIIVYKYRGKNIYCSLISSMGRLPYSEIFSVFDNNLMLSTANINTGHLPKPPNYYIQSLPNSDYGNLLAAHQDACEVLSEHGYLPCTIPLNTFRDAFTRVERTIMAYMFTKFLWPLRINLWLLLQSGRKYRKPLRDQFRLGTAQLPHRI